MVDGFSKTPRYLLKDGSHPTCPSLLQASPDDHSSVIFGFSDKPKYDAFSSASSLALKPYPLVQGFLKDQIDQNVGSLSLVVLDAVSSEQQCLYAATSQSVMESFQAESDSVAVSHRLSKAGSSPDYRIEKL